MSKTTFCESCARDYGFMILRIKEGQCKNIVLYVSSSKRPIVFVYWMDSKLIVTTSTLR